MAQKSRLAINMIANAVSFVVNLGVSFFLTPYLVNNVGSDAYSFIPIANNFVSYITIFTAALNSMASRFITIEINAGKKKEANTDFNSVLMANTIIAVMLTLPALLTIVYINKLLNVPPDIVKDVQLTFLFVFINTIIALIGNVFSVATFCKNRLDLSAKRTIQGNIIRAVVIIVLFALFQPKIYFITITTILVTLYTIITNIYYTKKLLPEIIINIKDFSTKAVKKLLSSGVWNSINQLSMVLLTTLDLMLANIFIGATAGGEYAIVKTIPNFIQSFVSMMVGVFIPQFTILYAQNNKEELLNSINNSIKIMGITVTLPIAFLMVFGGDFYRLWVPRGK